MNQNKNGQQTRQHILNCAQETFSELGYDSAGVAEICKRAGVSKGAFYHHFPSKHAVFMELLNQWLVTLDVKIQEVQESTITIQDAFYQFPFAVSDLDQLVRQWMPLFLEFWAQSMRDPEIWAVTIRPYQKYLQLFSRMIQKGIEEGSFRPLKSDLTSRIILSMAIGLILQGLLDPDQSDWTKDMSAGIELLFKGIERKS